MPIKPPPYCPNAQPTPIGWRDPRTREILAVRKLSQKDIDEYIASTMESSKNKPVVEVLTETTKTPKKTRKRKKKE
jgi:hypothetical protein